MTEELAVEAPDHTAGVMLCVRPDNPERFAMGGEGTPVEEIHLTLLYFGKTDKFDYSAAEQVKEVVGAEIASEVNPIVGEITGVTVFELAGEEEPPLVLLVDAPGLGELRYRALRALSAALGEDTQPKTNHDFMPHITVAYGATDEEKEWANSLVGEKVSFDFIEFVWGEETSTWALGGDGSQAAIPDEDDTSGLLLESGILSIPDEMSFGLAEEAEGMPYEIVENHSDCEGKGGVAVVKSGDGQVMGCHSSVEDAQKQLAALNAAEDKMDNSIESDEVLATDAVAPEGDVVEMTTEGAMDFKAMPVHHTDTVDTSGYDGDKVKVDTRSNETPAYYAKIYAWGDGSQDPGNKTGYKFPHHTVSAAGDPGPANLPATHAALMFIEDSGIPESDYRGVYNHLAAHLRDGNYDVPELGEDNASIDDVRAALALIRETTFEFTEETAAVEEAVVAEETEMDKPLDIAALSDNAMVGEILRRWIESVASKANSSSDVVEFAPVAPAVPAEAPDDDVEDDDEDDEPMIGGSSYEWEGVLIPEGVPSGDRRQIDEGALTWRDLPLPLMLQTANAEGHRGAVICGSIQEIERVNNNIVGRGNFDSGEAGNEARRLLGEGTMRGVSADIDSVVMELRDSDGNDISMEDVLMNGAVPLEVLVEGRIMGATLTPFPAFQEAFITVLTDEEMENDLALVASGLTYEGEVWRVNSPYEIVFNAMDKPVALEALVASGALAAPVEAVAGIPVAPPTEWFALQDMDEPQPFTVFPDGRCYGLIARFGSCHVGFRDRCVDVPRSPNGYKLFRNKNTLTAEGTLVATGPIFMDTVHPNLRMRASDASAHYAHTGCAVADVALYENEWGIVAAGALRPDASPEQVRRLRGSDISPDWRHIEHKLELVALLAVNMSGFIVPSLVASGAEGALEESPKESMAPRARFNTVTGEVEALVAAGAVRECRECGSKSVDDDVMVAIAEALSKHEAAIAKLDAFLAPMRREAALDRLTSFLDKD